MSVGERFLADTTVLIDASHRREPVVSWFTAVLESPDRLVTSAVCVAEFLVGIDDRDRDAAIAFLASLPVLPVSFDVAVQADAYRRTLRQRGVTILLPDALVAATARIADATLVTANVRDFPMTDLRVRSLGVPKRGG